MLLGFTDLYDPWPCVFEIFFEFNDRSHHPHR